ncbi:MAG: DUF4290 domain-containing protein [Candidatus Cyclobacteriaceae bacterium M2_1C_046]
MENLEYNTQRGDLQLKEYGRNVQKLAKYLKSIDDKEERTRKAHVLVDLMKQITPLRENNETDQKFWDDLFIMANFDLDIDSPFPPPPQDILEKKPQRLGYKTNSIKFRHYGKNIEKLVRQATEKEDPEEREEAIIYIGKLMKSFYTSWNKEVIDDAVILENIKQISGGELDINLDKVKDENLFEKLYKSRRKPTHQKSGGRSGGGGYKGKSNRRKRS